MKNSLFLHYGPGGNSYIEREELSTLWPKTLFWDQPHVRLDAKPLAQLKVHCLKQLQELTPSFNLLGHSFGCDLISLMQASAEKIILISPLKSIPHAMINLGLNLNAREPNAQLSAALKAAQNTSSMTAEIFWNLVVPVSTHPAYGLSFFNTAEFAAHYAKITSQGPAFDPLEWQTLIQDYLFTSPTSQRGFDQFKNKNVMAVFGEDDPYINIAKDLDYWKNLLGQDQVVVLKKCGHFPHLEHKSEFAQLVASRFSKK